MSLQTLIKRVLKEEVNKKYPKPTPNVEKLIYKWLDNYFSGSQMYHNKSWETRHDFEFCNKGKEVMNLILYFDDNENVYNDERTTEERDFDSGTLQVPKDIINELASVIPVRRTFLRYVIEEWFEDTYLGEIQSKMKRNDISIDEFGEYPDKSQICVPPMTKPDDVSLDDMINFVAANTLWSRKELEKKTPEYIEKTYLDKLRSQEMDRLRHN
jgi:hypothetical protein